MSAPSLFAREACEVCGPLDPPYVHAVCHGDHGCGHALDDHADSLRCRVCKRECSRVCNLNSGTV